MLSIAKGKLVIEVKRKRDKPKSKFSWKHAAGIVLLLVLFYIFTSGIPFSKAVVIKHNKTYAPGEPIIIEEPYTVVEYYTVKEPVGPKFCEDTIYNTSLSVVSKGLVVKDEQSYWNCSFFVTNNEPVNGTFIFFVNWITASGGYLSENQERDIAAGESSQFSFLHKMRDLTDTPNCLIQKDLLPKYYKCRVLEPAPYAVVEKARTVTKYRNVTKSENTTVSIESTEYVNKTYSVNKVFGYEQPFYFGY